MTEETCGAQYVEENGSQNLNASKSRFVIYVQYMIIIVPIVKIISETKGIRKLLL